MKKTGTIPMNIQLFADDDANGNNGTDDNVNANDGGNSDESNQTDKKPKIEKSKDQSKADEKPKEPTVQELMVELAKERRLREKANSEAANFKKQLRAKQSEEERIDAEKAEAKAAHDEYVASLERKIKISDTEKAYLSLGYTPDEVERIAVAEVDGDFDAKIKIIAEVDARKEKETEAKFYSNRPDVNAGVGGKVLTKEQFDKMSMVEQSKIFDTDRETYNRLMGIK